MLTKKLVKKEKVLVLEVTKKNKIVSCGQIKTWIKAKFLMEMIIHTDTDIWQALELVHYTLKECKYGDQEMQKILNNRQNIGTKDINSKY